MWIILIVFIVVLGGMGYAVYYQLQKTDPTKADTSTLDSLQTAQDFLPFDDIRDGMICLGGHQYRAVIECSSTNYNLKTDKEKEMIEVSFQRFLNSLTFPVAIYVQTKVMDNSKMLSVLQEELQDAINNYPHLSEYANAYFQEMNNLHSYIGNNKQKKKYVIIPYEEAISLANLSEEEKYDYSSKELYTRASMISEGLNSMGIKSKILNTQELAELVFSSYHKDNYTHVENVVNGEFLTLMVENEKKHMESMTEDARLDWILYEAQMRIQSELLNDQAPEFLKKNFEKAIREIDSLRDQTSGYYKQRDEVFVETEQSLSFEKDMLKQKVVSYEKGGR